MLRMEPGARRGRRRLSGDSTEEHEKTAIEADNALLRRFYSRCVGHATLNHKPLPRTAKSPLPNIAHAARFGFLFNLSDQMEMFSLSALGARCARPKGEWKIDAGRMEDKKKKKEREVSLIFFYC